MATNDANIINITTLPQAQDIVDGNFLIVQNDLGTQIIDWANLPVMKLDANDSGTINALTATDITVTTCNINSLTASALVGGDGGVGQSIDYSYYNQFSFSNGILTSAAYVYGSPEYENLLTTIIPEATAYSANIAQAVYEVYANPADTGGGIAIALNGYTGSVTWTPLPSELQYSDITDADCNISYTGGVVLSTTPFLCAFGLDINSNLTATLCLRQPAPDNLAVTDLLIKVSKHYTVTG